MQTGDASSAVGTTVDVARTARARPMGRSAIGWMVTIVVAALAVRLLALAVSAGHSYDIGVMQAWSRAMVEYPLSSFYGLQLNVPQDHLPGDLLVLAGIGEILTSMSTKSANDNYPAPDIIKGVAVLADVVLGLLIGWIARRFTTPRTALMAMSAFLLSPGVLYVSSIWGQWDAVSAAFAVGAICLAVRGRYCSALAWPALAYACLIKPQFVLIAPVFLLYFWKRDGLQGLIWSLLGIATGLGLVQGVLCLFGVGLPGVPARWSLIDIMRASVDRYEAISLGAHNIWILPIGRGAPLNDQGVIVGAVTFQVLGLLLFLLAVIGIYWCAVRFADPDTALAWGSTAVMFAMFITMTRMHERYAFPVLPLIVIAAIIMPRLRILAVLVHLAYVVNVHVAYTNGSAGPGLLQSDLFYRVNGLFFIILFVSVLWVGLSEAQGGRASPEKRNLFQTSLASQDEFSA